MADPNIDQKLSDAGINPFGVKLMVESYKRHPSPPTFGFEYGGVMVMLGLMPLGLNELEEALKELRASACKACYHIPCKCPKNPDELPKEQP